MAVSSKDSYESIATRFLGSAEAAWRLQEINGPRAPQQRVIMVPRGWSNPLGISATHQQLVPVLTYHRFGSRANRMTVTVDALREQLTYLRDNNYSVVRLAQLRDYIEGRAGLPPKAVVLTIDDGYQSAYKHALPVLREFGMPATLFVYTDFMNRGGVTTKQMREMLDSGVMDIQSHSKSHANLSQALPDETSAAYKTRITQEVSVAKKRLEELLDTEIFAFAFPYGATNSIVAEDINASGHSLALTVTRGGNPFYASPHLLRRSMVFGGVSLKGFAKLLQTERKF